MASATERPSFLLRLGTFVRFSHTVFALPFALTAMLVAGQGRVALPVFGWILGCMVCARTAAMCFNRIADWEFDKLNPRTADRHTLVTKPQAWVVLLAGSLGAIACSARLNPLCFRLSPLMLAIIFFYSLTKRFTPYSHLFLGLALSVAPMGAWAAVTGSLFASPVPSALAFAVLCWTFGFDLIYSTLDADFDRSKNLFSFPSRFGIPATLRLAKGLHLAASLGFAAFGALSGMGPAFWGAFAITLIALVWEHRLAASADPGQINRAFFQINALVSLTLLAGVCVHFRLWTLLA
ncbi:MAG: 4-hydroxybenzoate polyprenyltransferase [Verrucomicrobiota bacterium]|jgi:4-hydroxybenzoate polyprenyltransferase